MTIIRWFALVLATVSFTLSLADGTQAQTVEETAIEHFEKEIRPLLIEHCVKCHSGDTPDGDLDLSTRDGFQKGGMNGALVDSSDVTLSSLLVRITTSDEEQLMPPENRLTDDQVTAAREWIQQGAIWPQASEPITAKQEEKHWAFEPVTRPALPTVKNPDWCWTSIDRFLLAKMENAGIVPVSDTDSATWLRRITLDVTGLPPTVAQVTAPPTAGATQADELLATRSYAERQARRWLDVARYADTSGDGTDTPIPEARYYRDWVIDAFDEDMPYDQFLVEQIAGDILAKQHPDAPEAYLQQIATGYIALSRRFGNSKFAEMPQIIDDTIDTIGKSTMALSLGCARCHHHKFDPVTTEDYYSLYGYFDSTQYPHAGTEHQKERSDMPAIQIPDDQRDRYESTETWSVADKADPHNAKVHIAGDPNRKGEVVPRGFLSFLKPAAVTIPSNSSGRLELARLIASPENPLTARVMVNRIWQGHFGKGLVDNPSNFGLQTAQPVHHELLDYLASEFVQSGWSVKHIHRLILTSHVYRLSSHVQPAQQAIDEANQLYWHFPRLRMDAETLRDSLLAVSGRLQQGDGGRHPFKPTGELKYNQGSPFGEIFESDRRSVYLMTPRLNRHPMLALFDGADANVTTATRGESTVPLQALFVMNGSFVSKQAESLAGRALEVQSQRPQQIERLWQIVLGRSPDQDEIDSASAYLDRYQTARETAGSDPMHAQRDAWTSIARSLLASNEFIYVD